MDILTKAICLAATAHDSMTDKSGAPYILHPLRVMLAMETNIERVVAVLHDTVEDTKTDTGILTRAGFPPVVIDGIYGLSRRPGESYEMFIERIADSSLCTRVKVADLRDNLWPPRMAAWSTEPELKARLDQRYRAAYLRLTGNTYNP